MASPANSVPQHLPAAIDLVGRRDIRLIHEGEMWRMISARVTDERWGEEVVLYLRQGARVCEANLSPHERVIIVE